MLALPCRIAPGTSAMRCPQHSQMKLASAAGSGVSCNRFALGATGAGFAL